MSIAFICALPTGLNPGMISVDLSIKCFLDVTGLSAIHKATLFCTEQELLVSSRTGQLLHYKHLSKVDQLREYDHIIYWGDFAHWIEYSHKEWTKRGANTKLSPQQAEDKWFSLYFLEGNKDLIRKAITYGGTIYGLNAKQLQSKRYLSNLQAFFKNCRGAFFRDIYSANFIHQIAGRPSTSLSGDCALIQALHTTGAQSTDKSSPSTRKVMGLAVGRSGMPELLSQFSRNLAFQLNADILNLDWLNSRGIDGFYGCIDKIRSCDYLFTDIYHCGVNSISIGVPTISTGFAAQEATHTLSDKKKEIFFRQHLMAERYIPLENIESSIGNKAAALKLSSLAASRMNDIEATKLSHGLIKKVAFEGIANLYGCIVGNN